MSSFFEKISPYVEEELYLANQAEESGDVSLAFTHLENAHVLGQESTYWHVKVHFKMLRWGLRQKNFREVFGQVIRLIGAATLTEVKGVPIGNTGGCNVSPVQPMLIKKELAEIIDKAKEEV